MGLPGVIAQITPFIPGDWAHHGTFSQIGFLSAKVRQINGGKMQSRDAPLEPFREAAIEWEPRKGSLPVGG